MQHKFRKHQKVRILLPPNKEYIEYYVDPPVEIKKGMTGEVNLILPNGQYHVEIKDKQNKVIAYAPFDEENLESAE